MFSFFKKVFLNVVFANVFKLQKYVFTWLVYGEFLEDQFYYHLRNETKVNLPNDKEYDLALGKYTDYITVDDVSQDYTIYGAILGNASAYLLNDEFENTDANDFEVSMLSSRQDIIGWNWKRFNLDKNAYEILPNMTYIISTNSNYPCKLRFVDYLNDQGISGHPTFEYEILQSSSLGM